MNLKQPSPADQLETQVVSSLQHVLEKYQSIDCLADKMLSDTDSVKALDENMLLLKKQREEIEKMQIESSPLNQQYRESRQHASQTVHDLTNQIAGLIQGLLVKIGTLERNAKNSCEQLKPQIQNGVRALQMKKAYEKYN